MDTSRGTSAAVLPPELASMVPGPGLAAVLASVDRSALSAEAMFDLIAARARLLWHMQGELLADFAQAVAASLAAEPLPPDEDEEHVTDAVGEQVGWTVHWTTSYAQGRVWVAVALRQRLPMVLAALQAGQIDQAKAEAFVEALAGVADDVAVRIADRLLPKAVTWTLRELRASLRYHVDKADPGAARRRYARRVATRDVTLRAQPDGTANLSAQGLAPHRAAAAYDRIDRIARAARASGDARTLAQLRADALCDVLAGIPFHLSPGTDPITADVVLAAPLLAARPSQLRGSTAQADASAEIGMPPSWIVPAWRTESRFANRTSTDADPAGARHADGEDLGDDRRPGGDVGGDSRGSRGVRWSDMVPPEVAPVEVIDVYDYDRACLTDEDQAWARIGCEPPGAGEDETPDWWHACRPARRPPDHHPHRSTSRPPRQAEAKKSCSESRNSGPERSGSERPAEANPGREPSGYNEPGPRPSEDSRQDPDTTESRSRPQSASPRWWSDPEDVVWALAQADALHGRAILSPDVLAGDRCGCGGRLSVRPGVVDVQIKLTTLAGLDEDPALIPGLGVTLAPLARHIAFDPVTRPAWRWSVFDDHGELLHHGVTRHRPIGSESRFENAKTGPDHEPATRQCICSRFEPGHRRGTIELQLTQATLHELITDPTRAPGWQAVLADIAHQIQHGQLGQHDPTARMPDAVEEAFIRARDRSCRAPQCHVPASRCELDHRLEYAKGGPSDRGNVDCRCKRHHHLREHGYRITKTGTTTTWTVPNGRTYTVTTDKDLILTRED